MALTATLDGAEGRLDFERGRVERGFDPLRFGTVAEQQTQRT